MCVKIEKKKLQEHFKLLKKTKEIFQIWDKILQVPNNI